MVGVKVGGIRLSDACFTSTPSIAETRDTPRTLLREKRFTLPASCRFLKGELSNKRLSDRNAYGQLEIFRYRR